MALIVLESLYESFMRASHVFQMDDEFASLKTFSI